MLDYLSPRVVETVTRGVFGPVFVERTGYTLRVNAHASVGGIDLILFTVIGDHGVASTVVLAPCDLETETAVSDAIRRGVEAFADRVVGGT
jgi:hypothetical protein